MKKLDLYDKWCLCVSIFVFCMCSSIIIYGVLKQLILTPIIGFLFAVVGPLGIYLDWRDYKKKKKND